MFLARDHSSSAQSLADIPFIFPSALPRTSEHIRDLVNAHATSSYFELLHQPPSSSPHQDRFLSLQVRLALPASFSTFLLPQKLFNLRSQFSDFSIRVSEFSTTRG